MVSLIARHLIVSNSGRRPRLQEPLLQRLWDWCSDVATHGWLVTLAVTLLLFAWLLPYMDRLTAATLQACNIGP